MISHNGSDGGGMRDSMGKIDPLLVALWAALIVCALVWLVPLVFIVFTSLKTENDIFNSPAFMPPSSVFFANYADAWRRGNFGVTFLNSVVITFIKVPLGLVLAAMAAYVLAQMEVRWKKFLFVLFIVGTMLPFKVMLAPLFAMVNSLGLIDTYVGAILPYIAFGVPYQIFILHGFFSGVPKELTEAALIDGASHFTIFRRIFLSLSLPALAALFILDFVSTWNEFAMALVLLQNSGMWTLPLGLMVFQGQFENVYGPLNAAIVMTILPATIVYLIFQRYFVSGLAAGAVKG
ncbi:MAG: carbohydrate ABC transporter permease [Planctomycetota bacterium]|jgi:raffinose/stachyose/melibiose transport system permease protein|nr:carbohydrate ABC transporter permease [Planctomycetota bacterium]